MRFVVAALVLLPVVLLVVGSVRGRVRVTSCCALPAERDSRLVAAYADEPQPVRSPSAGMSRTQGAATTSVRT